MPRISPIESSSSAVWPVTAIALTIRDSARSRCSWLLGWARANAMAKLFRTGGELGLERSEISRCAIAFSYPSRQWAPPLFLWADRPQQTARNATAESRTLAGHFNRCDLWSVVAAAAIQIRDVCANERRTQSNQRQLGENTHGRPRPVDNPGNCLEHTAQHAAGLCDCWGSTWTRCFQIPRMESSGDRQIVVEHHSQKMESFQIQLQCLKLTFSRHTPLHEYNESLTIGWC